MSHVYSVVFNGRTFTRKSEHEYTHAAFNTNRKGHAAWVSFHGSHNAAKRAAGATGEVKPVSVSIKPAAKCVVCLDERYIETRHSDGKMHRHPCYRCNNA